MHTPDRSNTDNSPKRKAIAAARRRVKLARRWNRGLRRTGGKPHAR